MRVTDAVTDRIRQRREKLERAGVMKPELADGVPTDVHLWLVDLEGNITAANEHTGIAGIDLIALPTGKFLKGDFGTTQQIPWVDHVRMFAHLPDVPPQTPTVPRLIDAPENPYPAPTHSAEIVEMPAAPEGEVEMDRDAVLIDLAAHRAKRETATEIVHRIHKERMAKIVQSEPLPQREEPKPARMMAMPPQWTPHS